MKVIETRLPGVLVIEPDVFKDARGFFMETWHSERYREAGLPAGFVQDNVSFSTRGVLRGLHYQYPSAQGKLVYVLYGEIYDVAVDIRVGSPTFGRWEGAILSADNKRQFYVSEGFAHGFCVTSESALVVYKCTDLYNPRAEGGVFWNDPGLGIDWPVENLILSEKDKRWPRLQSIPEAVLPRWRGGG